MNRDEFQLEWWRLACELEPSPISFVDKNSKFLFCNNAFCELLGYSESELKEMTWLDITKQKDKGSDDSESKGIITGTKEDYYLEKTYIRKDGTDLVVSIYVHRYPQFGPHEGYIVFTRKLYSQEYQDLKEKFFDLQKTVLVMQQNALSTDTILRNMSLLESEIRHNKEMMLNFMTKSSINIGDRVSGDHVGRDKTTNQTMLIIILAVVLGVTSLGFMILTAGGYLKVEHKNTNVEVSK